MPSPGGPSLPMAVLPHCWDSPNWKTVWLPGVTGTGELVLLAAPPLQEAVAPFCTSLVSQVISSLFIPWACWEWNYFKTSDKLFLFHHHHHCCKGRQIQGIKQPLENLYLGLDPWWPFGWRKRELVTVMVLQIRKIYTLACQGQACLFLSFFLSF